MTARIAKSEASRERRSAVGVLAMIAVVVASALFDTPRLWAIADRPVRIASGLVVGMTDPTTGVAVFKGIPYAAPPVGELRWREPQPVTPWSDTRRADRFAPPCMQPLSTAAAPGVSPAAFDENLRLAGPTSEDCLYLNVWTAARKPRERRPVVVWIPGGGFTRGSPVRPATDGAALSRRGVVLVSISYRLGVFGFLSHPELTAESPNRSSGHYGLLDQIAALRWVQKNITAFGGDPANVTVLGQSAGAIAINALMASPLARGLFARVAATSGWAVLPGAPLPFPSPALPRGETQSDADARGVTFAARLGAASVRDLRNRAPEELAKAAAGDAMSIAHVDGWLLPTQVERAFEAGRQADVPMLIGWTSNEAEIVRPPSVTSLVALREYARSRYGAHQEAFDRLYPATTDAEAQEAFRAHMNDVFGFAMRRWVRLHRQTAASPTFMFQFDRTAPDAQARGAHHGSETVYLFGNVLTSRRQFTDVDRGLSETLASALVRFAQTGTPNGKGLPNWPAYEERRDRVLVIGDRIEARVLPRKAAIDLYESVFSLGRPAMESLRPNR